MNKSIKLIFNYLLAPALFLLLTVSLYRQISSQPDLSERWLHIRESWHNLSFWIVFLMMFLNWGIEARKWQLLISPLEKISFSTSFKSVFAGCSVSMLTPNRIAEYGGRILFVQPYNRIRAISVTILGSLSQLLVTLFIGSCGLVYLNYFSTSAAIVPWINSDVLVLVSISVTVILSMLFFQIQWVVNFMQKFAFLKNLMKHLTILDYFRGKQLLRILLFSFIRYIIFILQYVLLLNVLEVNVSIHISLSLLTIFYLVMALAPTIGFIELPVRAAASVELFKLYSENIVGIQAAAFGIWIINLVLPAIIGSILIFGIKILKER